MAALVSWATRPPYRLERRTLTRNDNRDTPSRMSLHTRPPDTAPRVAQAVWWFMALSCAAGLLLNGGRVVSTLGDAHPRIESHGRITELRLPGDDRVAEALRHREAYATRAGE